VTDERRGSPRLAASLAGEIETSEGKSSIAISRDVSPGGLMIFSRSRLAAGTRVKMKVVFQGETQELEGDVLRCEELEPGSSTLWRTRVAIAVDPTHPVLSRIYTALAAEPN
jgi:CRISPR/Cas system CSM-associated protein Csm3 (group 7 of RAMP superfamily)